MQDGRARAAAWHLRSAFQLGHLVLENVVGWIHDPRVDGSELSESEELAPMFCALELERSGLEDWYGASAIIGIKLVAVVKRDGGEALLVGVRHRNETTNNVVIARAPQTRGRSLKSSKPQIRREVLCFCSFAAEACGVI